jgi:response regulator RpfG family c-di-GMP phosphodiesterase
MQMPGMNGVEFLMELGKAAPDTVRIMLTGNADQKTARDAVNQGHIFRFLTKPCPPEELMLALRAGLKQYQLVTAERDVLERTLNGSARMLSDILAMHDAHAFGKSQRLREYMRAFADAFAIEANLGPGIGGHALANRLRHHPASRAGTLPCRPPAGRGGGRHDGARAANRPHLLSHIPRLESVAAVVLYQNKNFDGTGFPADKIAGEDIPIGARILRVLQDLMAYESAKGSKAKALENMTLSRRYDPRVLEAVAAVFDICLERGAT